MLKNNRKSSDKKVIYREEVFDRDGNFLGYVEDCKDGLFNHYDQDGNYLDTTSSRRFNYEKARRMLEDEEDEDS